MRCYRIVTTVTATACGLVTDMPTAGAQLPAPPDGIRPGQFGVVTLRRVIIGDIAATLVDPSIRRLLRIEEHDGEPDGWLVVPLHAIASRHRQDSLLRYEQTLLDGLSQGGAAASLASLAPQMPRVLQELARNWCMMRFTAAGSGTCALTSAPTPESSWPAGSAASTVPFAGPPPSKARTPWPAPCCRTLCAWL
jgi:hypothetical protein